MHVVAGVLRDGEGRVLLTQRPPGKHLAGMWEFPGGKCEAGETASGALRRELSEELDVEIGAVDKLIAVPWRYREKSICLHVYLVREYAGVLHGREGQAWRWVAPEAIDAAELPPADRPVLTALRLPRRYVISTEPAAASFLRELENVLGRGETLIQLRSKRLEGTALRALLAPAQELAARGGAKMLLSAHADLVEEFHLAGVHLPSDQLMRHRSRPLPAKFLVAASCHDERELAHAAELGIDFAVLGPVAAARSHESRIPLGWDRFEALCAAAPFPVFALGGMGDGDLPTALGAGAHGIAGISAFWPAARG